ncbi:polyamine-transporting ATPase 13A3-like isoform X2 [Mytilus galloprovincialis]|uniref:polyamine-transporting ATPase 13A3-like isoform X2 n=1 Tax=Mytilus galloprovincialis TaxID=29158 RepID=UPI003F7B9182
MESVLKAMVKRSAWVTGPPPMNPSKRYVNPGTEEQMSIEGYKKNRWKLAIAYLLYILTGGLLRLVFYWLPHWLLKFTHDKCFLHQADSVLLQDQYLQWFVSRVVITTKDGTRVKIVKTSASLIFRPKQRDRELENMSRYKETTETYENSCNYSSNDDSLVKYFMVKKVKYVWNTEKSDFLKLKGLDENMCSFFHESQGLSYTDQIKRRVVYGTNSIAIHVTPIIVLLFKEALSPFYVFQAFSVSVWFSDEYEIYAACIIFISVGSLAMTIYQIRKAQRALRNTIQSSTIVTVCKGEEKYEDIPSEDLVPGDVIEIPRRGCFMQCDAVLVTGNCIVNESMLTGESVPVTKTPLPNPKLQTNDGSKDIKFDIKEHARHTLFCGTHVIQTRYYGTQKVKAVVVRTGFYTAKGELVKSILFPKPVDFKFERDTYKFVGVLAMIACLGFIYTVIMEIRNGKTAGQMILRCLDLITITVPPALPAALAVGIVFAQHRLKQLKIYCISPKAINVCGSINAVCFDKTGTLTEDGLMMKCVVQVDNNQFQEDEDAMLLRNGPLVYNMATCHSLTIIDKNLSGDPLDLIMFEAIGWDLEEPGQEECRFDMMVPTVVFPSPKHHPGSNNVQIGVVRQFTFTSSLQRMSVIVRNLIDDHFELYCKGAPEMIASLCNPQSVPEDFQSKLSSYTQHGYRVIAMGWKPLSSKMNFVKVQRVQREQVERDLTFLGFLVMENKLKPETTAVIQELKEADIRTIMVTGDNMLTALSVARECGMVNKPDHIIMVECFMNSGLAEESQPAMEFVYAEDRNKPVEEISTDLDMKIQIEEVGGEMFHFAVTGKSFSVLRQHFPDTLSKIVVRGTVFARMSPDQKAQLVEILQQIGYYVAMCGDGANDCGALKMAHSGISLSEAEASVASPFTSKTPNITCVPNLIKQGRAALVTSFGIFKYMACYSLTQFTSVCILYWIGINLTDFEFLYVDLFLLASLSITFGRTDAYPELSKDPPAFSLTSLLPITSIVLHMIIQVTVQIFSFVHVRQQPWFTPHVPNEDDEYASYENSAVFYVSTYQFMTLAVTFAKGSPYRRSMFNNYWFLANLVICLGVTLWITIYPPPAILDFIELKPPPVITYRLLYVGVAGVNFLLCVLLETYFIDNIYTRRKLHAMAEKILPGWSSEYSTIEHEMKTSPDWPPPISRECSRTNGYLRMDSLPESETAELLLDTESGSETSLNKSSSSLKKCFKGDNFSSKTNDNIKESNKLVLRIESNSDDDVALLDS